MCPYPNKEPHHESTFPSSRYYQPPLARRKDWVAPSRLTLTACQPIVAPPATAVPTIATTTPAPTATPSAFTYGVTVLDANGQPIADAQVIIEIEGKAPLENEADEHGYARIAVPASHAERLGRLRVRADGFEAFDQNIDIYQERLPNEVRLIAQVVGNTVGFCPDNLTFATGFAPAKANETLVVVSNFADTLGNDPRNLTFDLVERMGETLKPHNKIRVERLNCAIKQQGGSETAITLAIELNHPSLPALQALLAEINAQRGE